MQLNLYCLPRKVGIPTTSAEGGSGCTIKRLNVATKTLRIMQLTAVFLLGVCLQVTANVASQTVTLDVKNAPLEKVFAEVKKQTGYVIISNAEHLSLASPITISAKEEKLSDFFERLLKDQPLTYVINKTTIGIRKKEGHAALTIEKNGPPVTGVVRGPDGQPLAGANVTIKGTKIGTTTDADGKFSLVGKQADILVISSIGFGTKEVIINTSNLLLVVTLEISNSPLDEVQVIAYGETSKRFNTGNVSRVKSQEISNQVINNPLAALEGRVPGLQIQQRTGVPGGGYKVNIRGLNSIANGNEPFYIVDGVPYISTRLSADVTTSAIINDASPLSFLNPYDIASIEILKDADATAIYGSRGANGVILITTKKGKIGQPKFDVNIYSGVGKITKKMDLLRTPEYLQMRKEAFKNDGIIPEIYNAYDLLVWDSTKNTDWQKELIGGTAHIADAQASLSGGSTSTQFLVGGGYHKETTVFPGDFSDTKGTAHFSMTNSSIRDKLKLTFTASYLSDNNKLPFFDLTKLALTIPPNAPSLYDSNANVNWNTNNFFYANGDNHPGALLRRTYQGNTENLIANAIMSYEIIPGLQFRSSFGYTSTTVKEKTTVPRSTMDPSVTWLQSYTNFATNTTKTWIIEPQLEYKARLGKGVLNILLGSTYQQNIRDGQAVQATGFATDALLENIQSASDIIPYEATNFAYRYNAVFSRITYNLKDKYIINLTDRRDGSSRFGPNRQFANFGAAGAAWIFSSEKFVRTVAPFLSYGKVRTSYGTSGNDQVGDYKFLSTWSSTIYPYQISGLYPTGLYNPDFSWEINKKMEAAVELGFFEDKILFSASYYRNRSTNQLVGFPLPPTTGFTTVQSNLPAIVQNTGWEFELNTINFNNKNFSWSTNVNVTVPQNKLIAYPNIEGSPYANIYTIGESIFSPKTYRYLGIDRNTGVYSFEDINKDGVITYPEDLQSPPKFGQELYGGIQNNLQVRGFQFTFLFQYVIQRHYNYMTASPIPGIRANQPAIIMDRWKQPGENTNIQRFTQSYGSDPWNAYIQSTTAGDNIISNSSFLRLKNVSLSYNLPDSWLHKKHINNVRIYLMGQNLITVTNYLGMDPEAGLTQDLPPLRTLTAGVQLTF